jgi:hypothetical protein
LTAIAAHHSKSNALAQADAGYEAAKSAAEQSGLPLREEEQTAIAPGG